MQGVGAAAAFEQFAAAGFAGLPVDLVGQGPVALGVGVGVGEIAVCQAGDDAAAVGVGVIAAQQDGRVHDGEGVRFLPLPVGFAVDLAAAEPVAGEQQVASRVDLDDGVEGFDGLHQALDGARVAPVEIQQGAVEVDALLVGMQLVGFDGGQAVGEHAVAVVGIGQRQHGGVEDVRVHAHQGDAGPLLHQVRVVGNTAAEIAVGHLALVDPPADVAARGFEVFQLPERPGGHALGHSGQFDGQRALVGVADVVPVLAAEGVVRVDAQQVGDVRI
ncbi:hypothetical protein XAUC_07760 [Xanthomonas citri pv. aurantifolii str. ICPB 10535]|nr:hypothetical protein XAUC_07760 [Xanthomonas citri pv. aurantifolii str. ICPB 10535]